MASNGGQYLRRRGRRLLAGSSDESVVRAISFGFAVAAFFLSLEVYPWYYSGDQVYYRAFYEEAALVSKGEVIDLQEAILSSREPIYAFFVYAVAPYLEKDFVFSFLNGALAYQASVLLLRAGAHPISVGIIVLLNFYSFVLYFAAERLKIGLLFFLVGMNSVGPVRLVWMILSPLAHSQFLVLCVSAVTGRPRALQRFSTYISKAPMRTLGLVGMLAVAMFLPIDLLGSHISDKWQFYQVRNLSETLKGAVFLVAALCVSRERFRVVLAMVPLFVAIYFVGGARLNIFVFYVFLYFSFLRSSRSAVPALMAMAYFAYTGLVFLGEVKEFGTAIYE